MGRCRLSSSDWVAAQARPSARSPWSRPALTPWAAGGALNDSDQERFPAASGVNRPNLWFPVAATSGAARWRLLRSFPATGVGHPGRLGRIRRRGLGGPAEPTPGGPGASRPPPTPKRPGRGSTPEDVEGKAALGWRGHHECHAPIPNRAARRSSGFCRRARRSGGGEPQLGLSATTSATTGPSWWAGAGGSKSFRGRSSFVAEIPRLRFAPLGMTKNG